MPTLLPPDLQSRHERYGQDAAYRELVDTLVLMLDGGVWTYDILDALPVAQALKREHEAQDQMREFRATAQPLWIFRHT